MEVSFQVEKSIKFTLYNTVFFYFRWGSFDEVFGKVVVNRTSYQGCQFDVHFI